jgi:hypothetical protein
MFERIVDLRFFELTSRWFGRVSGNPGSSQEEARRSREK